MKKSFLFLTMAVLAAALSFGISGRIHSNQSIPQPCSLEPLTEYLSLASEQVRRIEPMFAEHQRKRRDALLRREEAVAQLVDVLRSKDASKAEIDKATARVDTSQAELRRLMVGHLLQLKAVLTPAQSEKLFDLVGRRCLGSSCADGPSQLLKHQK
ncbi:MAG: periplasmic heavy metal sensor [bacterium]|nr:periplasmic heavy metal sensor [bacterium]